MELLSDAKRFSYAPAEKPGIVGKMKSKGQIYKFLSADGFIRASSFVGTDLLNEMRTIQNTSPPSTMALGRALCGVTLLATLLKNGQAVSLQIQCEGPLKMVFAQASYEGKVRAFISEPQLPMAVEGSHLVLSPHVGDGTLTMTTYLSADSLPQRSQILVESGEITEDIANYIRTSQQTPCALSTGIVFGPEGIVKSAGGILIELMPGHTEKEALLVEQSLNSLGSLSQVLASGSTPEDLLRLVFLGIPGQFWEHPFPVEIACTCSLDKVLNSIKLLGEKELQKIIDEKEPHIDVGCEMCGKKYQATQNDIKAIYNEIKGFH